VSDPIAGTRAADVRRMTFDNNALLAVLYGNHDRNLVRIEQLANVQLAARGNQPCWRCARSSTAITALA
jgi:phosphate starvation-inducible PhoH-like protein